jgi:thiamine-monophosphate kinase
MAEKEKRTDISELGEFGLIDHLTQNIKLNNPSSHMGVGDDAALIENGDLLTVVSTDLLIEGIHFDLMYTPLKHLGYKSVVVNLSDIYAMNARPKQITVSLGLSNRFSVEALEEFYMGVNRACEVYGVDLVGGDTSSSNKGFIISVTAIGQVEKDKYVTRSGAKEGDLICVTGELGGAFIGLQLMEREKQVFLSGQDPHFKADFEDQKYAVGRQLLPEARKDIIEFFEKAGVRPTAMMDISDGLASELFHIATKSGVGAFIEEEEVPMHMEVQQMAIKFNMDPITAALSGGEDYEMLFTIDPKDVDKVRFQGEISVIGQIVDQKEGVKLHTSGGKIHDIQAQGWKHFGA